MDPGCEATTSKGCGDAPWAPPHARLHAPAAQLAVAAADGPGLACIQGGWLA